MSGRILYVQFTEPAALPPLQHSSRILAERGWDILFLGIGPAEGLKLKVPDHPRIRTKYVRFVQPGWKQKVHYLLFLLWTLYWICRWRPTWIYASDPFACPIAWIIQRFSKIPVAYHEHDSPSDDQSGAWTIRGVLAFRKKLGRDAAICILPQKERLVRFATATQRTKPTYCVWNCPRREEIPPAVGASETTPLILYYHGNISADLLPNAVLAAVRRFEGSVRLRVAGYETVGNKGYLEEMSRQTVGHGSNLIQSLGSFNRTELFHVASTAHIGLCVMPRSTENYNLVHMVGASNKAFDYMACGLPLLVTDLPEWIATFVEPGYALACNPDDPNSIEAALRWYLEHPHQRREMGRRCKEKIRQAWNYETMFADVLSELEGGVRRDVAFAPQSYPEPGEETWKG